MNRLKGSGTIIALATLVLCLSWAQETGRPTPPADAPAPVARAEQQAQVDALHQLLHEKNYDAALKQSAALLSQARDAGDKIAEAYALRAQAIALQSKNRPEEAANAWAQTAALWSEIGDVPNEVEALLSQLWLLREPAAQGQAILARALQAAQRRTDRPLALADILQEYALRFYGEKRLDIAQTLFEQAIKTRSVVAPEAKELATGYRFLGEIYTAWRNLTKAKDAYERALSILDKVAPKSLERITILSSLAALEERLRQYDKALEHAETALNLANELNAPPQARATLLIQAGSLHHKVNQPEQAETLIQQGIEICLRHPEIDRRLLVDAYELLATGAFRQSQVDRAIEYANRAWQQQEQINPASIDAARVLSLKATLSLQKYDIKRGIEYAERAWEIAQRADPDAESPDMVQIFVAVAAARLLQLKTNEALELLTRAREVALQSGDLRALSVILSMLHQLLRVLGRAEQAQQYQRELDALGQQDLLEPVAQIFTLTTQAQAALNDGDYFAGLRLASQALEHCRQTTDVPLIRRQEIILLTLLGSAYARLGDFQAARNAFTVAYQLCKKIDSSPLMLAGIETNLGAVCFELGQYDDALQFLTAARERLGETLHFDAIPCLINLGHVYLWRGEYDKARAEVKRAADWLREQGVNTLLRVRVLVALSYIEIQRRDFEAARGYLDEASQLYDSLQASSPEPIVLNMNRARIYTAQGDRLNAERALEEAVRLLEEQRGMRFDPEMRTLFAEQYGDVYVLQAQLYVRAGDYARAAEALERSRARTLSEQIQERQLAFQSDDENLRPLLQELEQTRREQHRVASRLIAARFDSPEWAQLQQQRNAAKLRYQSLLQQLERVSPRHMELLTPPPLKIDQIQSALEPGTALLYYAVAQEELLIIAVTRDTVRGVAHPISAAELTRLADRFRTILSTPPTNRTALDRRDMLALGKQLYGHLVRPVENVLENARRVVLCPMGQLNLLPWAALVVDGDSPTNAVYWVEKVALHFTPSMGVYSQARKVAPSSDRVLAAALGYKDLPSTSVSLTPQGEYATRVEITPLPSAEEEAEAIARHMKQGVRTLLNESATPEAVRANSQEAGVVHFTCHAFANSHDPYSSVLVLAPPLQEAGLLRAADIMDRWRLRADLVMLAACESSQGVVRRHEGVFGLARAFLFAGARSVGATLWQIGDKSTALLMDAFYARYAQGTPKDEALRQAQIAMRKNREFHDPYFWSGFILIGDYRNGFGSARPQAPQ